MPGFARRPPFRIPARPLGVALAAVAGLVLLQGGFFLLTDLFLAPRRLSVDGLPIAAQLVASALGLIGGYQMAGGDWHGKLLVIYSLGINVAATLLLLLVRGVHVEQVLLLAGWATIYYLLVISRFGTMTAR
jgi:hypothetical protein